MYPRNAQRFKNNKSSKFQTNILIEIPNVESLMSNSIRSVSFSSEQMEEIRTMYKELKHNLLETLDEHQRNILLMLRNITITSFIPFFEQPKNYHPLNKTGYSQKYLSITCVYNPENHTFTSKENETRKIQESSKNRNTEDNNTELKEEENISEDSEDVLFMYLFGFYKLKESLTPHTIEFTVSSIATQTFEKNDDSLRRIEGALKQTQDRYWIIEFKRKELQKILFRKDHPIKLDFEGILI
jgi:hypothetical protein